MSNKGFEINGNVGSIQIQQGCVDSTMNVTIVNDSQFFIKAQEILDSVNQYESEFTSVFQDKECEVKFELEIAQSSIDMKDRPRLSKALKTIKDIAKSIPGNVIASGIVNLITGSGV